MNAPNTLAVMNLLAVIHRDGGQHTHQVGVEQSCKDAQQKVLDMRKHIDEVFLTKQAEVPLTVIHEPEFPTGAALQAQLGAFPATNREKTLAEKIAEARQRITEGEVNKEPLL